MVIGNFSLILKSVPREHVFLHNPAANQVLAYDPRTGHELWKVAYNGYSNVTRPVYGRGLLFIQYGERCRAVLIINATCQDNRSVPNLSTIKDIDGTGMDETRLAPSIGLDADEI